jgi:hypothetical protein
VMLSAVTLLGSGTSATVARVVSSRT